jgi:DNA-binding NarL/FixJ family response regulator
MFPSTTKITIQFVEELALYREGLRHLFDAMPEVDLLGYSSSGAELIDQSVRNPADIILIDLHLNDHYALEVVRRLRAAGVQSKLVLLANRADPKTATEAIRSGAHGLVLKSSTPEQILEACRQILSGAVYVDPHVELTQTLTNVVRRDPNDPLESLSSREHQVFTLLIEGIRAKEIAARLSVSPKTVDTYRASLMRKLNIHDLAGLVKYAIQRQLITAD